MCHHTRPIPNISVVLNVLRKQTNKPLSYFRVTLGWRVSRTINNVLSTEKKTEAPVLSGEREAWSSHFGPVRDSSASASQREDPSAPRTGVASALRDSSSSGSEEEPDSTAPCQEAWGHIRSERRPRPGPSPPSPHV